MLWWDLVLTCVTEPGLDWRCLAQELDGSLRKKELERSNTVAGKDGQATSAEKLPDGHSESQRETRTWTAQNAQSLLTCFSFLSFYPLRAGVAAAAAVVVVVVVVLEIVVIVITK